MLKTTRRCARKHPSAWPPAAIRAGTSRAVVFAKATPGRTIANLATVPKLIVALTLLAMIPFAGTSISCASSKAMAPEEARRQVEQLMTLYRENRAKFTLQKQHLQELQDCSEATSLRDAAKKWNDEANMQPGNSEDNFKLYSELDQAEKACRAK